MVREVAALRAAPRPARAVPIRTAAVPACRAVRAIAATPTQVSSKLRHNSSETKTNVIYTCQKEKQCAMILKKN